MSNPTSAEVRGYYARGVRNEHDRTWQSGADEFDQWLREHDAKVWDEGWHAGWVNRHTSHADAEGYVGARLPIGNPYEAEADSAEKGAASWLTFRSSSRQPPRSTRASATRWAPDRSRATEATPHPSTQEEHRD